ncbi:Tetratricopeptide repeat protein [compost metagenome]|uniref:tetratricopeptide repeat protein n=1 Tax=Pseudomonas sp. JUb96 TaxID=2940539 RepID=UPI000F9F33C2|nr:tetratricopeptide repeat protein [Pseudomonas sp. JUb96]MCW2270603.1 tetratricopeptide (TPR) repeat protein [Pseudomonas sp. JUb96]
MNDYCQIVEKSKNLPTIISFSAINTPRGKFKPYKTVVEANANVIFVNDCDNSWYQNGVVGVGSSPQEAARALVQMAREIGNGRVVTFGTSMGAFGAMLYAALGNADGCMAFGPEPVLNLAGSRSKIHIPQSTTVRYESLVETIRASAASFYVYFSEADEMDIIGAYLLRDLQNVTLTSVRGVGHPGVQAFDLEKSIPIHLTTFAHSGITPQNFERKGSILDSHGAISKLWDAFNARNAKVSIDEQISILERAITSWPHLPFTRLKLGNAYASAKRIDEANVSWRLASELCPFQFDALTRMGELLVAKPALVDAIEYLKKAIDINPWHATAHYQLAIAHKKSKRYDLAEQHFRLANSTSGGRTLFKKGLADFLHQLAKIKNSEADLIFEQLAQKTAPIT